MAFDINNNYTGNLFGRDRIGHTTPDAEATEVLRPWLPVPYPAPYLPTARQDQGHPVLANVVLSSQYLIGQDVSGGFVPAGLFCGTQAVASHGGTYCVLKYGASDVGFAYNANTGNLVAAAGELAFLACPADAAVADVITFSDGTTYTIPNNATGTGQIAAAKACTLFPNGTVKPIGLTIRNVLQYIGGVTVTNQTAGDASTNGSMKYTLNGVIPIKFKVHNYMHEMGTALQTAMVIRLPWIGATPSTLGSLASGVVGYVQSNYSRSFVHYTGTPKYGSLVVGSKQLGDAGHYSDYSSTNNDIADICGRIVGIQNMFPIRDYANRVRTLWDPSRLIGPIKDPNPSSIMMGGSQTGGIDYQLNLGTDGVFKKAYDQGATLRAEYSTFVLVKVGVML